ncbi:hypothetical protein J6590_007567 [Homalodisca vitripennis]|nr:hypothetical protein J6590_007567 [Homalodisca vitripennis]
MKMGGGRDKERQASPSDDQARVCMQKASIMSSIVESTVSSVVDAFTLQSQHHPSSWLTI